MDSKNNTKLLNGPYRATKLWNEIVEEFCNGINLRKHRRQMRQYNDCFTAREAVDWLHQFLCKNPNFGDKVSRLQTILLLSKLQQCNIISSVNGQNKIFVDNQDLYRINSENRVPFRQLNNEEQCQEIESNDEAASLTIAETEHVWKCVLVERLITALSLSNIRDLLDDSLINPKYIIHNVTRSGSSGVVVPLTKSEEIPSWVTSAMKCLMSWPKASGDESCLPKYPGFERDVFKVIKDYFLNLEEPLTTFGMYNILMAIYDRIKFLKACSSYKFTPNMCYETEFLTDEPITRIISPLKQTSAVNLCSGSTTSIQNVATHKITARSYSVDNFDKLSSANKRASFRDRLKHKLQRKLPSSNSVSSLAASSADASFHDIGDDERYLEKDVLWVMQRVKNFQTQSASSSAASFHTAVSELSTPLKSDFVNQTNWSQITIDSLRMALLLLSPDSRRNLHLLLRFMDKVGRNQKLQLVPEQSNHDFILRTLASTILYPKKRSEYNELSHLSLVTFMVDNQESIFKICDDLAEDVKTRSKLLRQNQIKDSNLKFLSYCEMVSREEYERQKNEGFEENMIELLKGIIDNDQLSEREKDKKLKQFKKVYPEIYKKVFPSEHLTTQRKSQIFSKQLKILRALRI